MAYDLSSFYTRNLSANSLSKTIIDQLMANRRFSSVSKITLGGTNYSSGSAGSDPIGYTETGRPIYEQSVGITMNDELKDTIEKKHARNTDSMLRNIGSTVLENTSTGNIVAFISQGVIRAFITEDGRFTGKVRLENIEDLDKLTLDTSRFYIKAEVDSLLSAKLSKAYLFNADNKIKSEYIDRDIVRHTVFDPHFNDDIRHITLAERNAWNAKYDKPAEGIPMKDLDTAVSDRINASALQVDHASHVNNLDIHTSSSERAKWNSKYDKPSTGVPMTDLSEIVQNNINEKAKQADLVSHVDNTTVHITAEERIKWNGRYQKPTAGIPLSHLEAFVQEVINNSASDAELSAHTGDTVVHITNAERLTWNAKYLKPTTGVPLSDLDSAVQNRIVSSATKDEVANHTSNTTVHITADERDKWNSHRADLVVHITGEERTKWNNKYDKPSTGIPEADLNASLVSKINGMTTVTDFNEHNTDSVKHVTQSERDKWNGKYDKPLSGIPMEHLATEVVNKINASATNADLNAHKLDAVVHISGAERSSWNAKYDKPVAGIPETDLSLTFREKVAGLASTVALTTHTGDIVKHITAEERASWNGRYVKPSTGIPATDLESVLKAKIDATATNADLLAHTGDNVIHISAEERSSWNAKYVKPSTGVPETDLEQALRTKINNMVTTTDFNAHATDTTKHIGASERANWNGKYSKPNTGIPLTDLSTAVQDILNSSATVTALNNHTADTVAHVSGSERSAWNAKYDKPLAGIPEVDLNVDFTDKVNLAVEHTGDVVSHITAEERTAWNGKYAKPVAGIPVADLEGSVGTAIASANTHVADADIHVTADQKTAWDGKYAKPEAGVPLEDLVVELQNKLNAVAVPYTKTVSVEATTVAISASEHGINHTNAFEFSVVAYAQNGDFFETVQPSLVRVNATTKDIEVQFASAFVGKIVVR
jgi:hypothetical protein